MIVYVLVPEAVYQQGVIGVYATEDDAVAAAREIWPNTDGHHKMVIHPRVIGETMADVFTWRTAYPNNPPGEPKIEMRIPS